jgi:hypothetical protein
MSTNCAPKLTADILFDCADKSKRGLDGGKAVLINFEDIDKAASTVAGAVISDLVTKSGTSGFAAEWFKDLASVNSSFAPSTEDIDGFIHNFLCRIPNASADNAERARELAQGRFVIVVETRYKGALSAEAFKVFGWENGLKLSEMTYNTLENSGSIPYTAATEDGDVESYPYNVFLETDYATSKATFDSLFATV